MVISGTRIALAAVALGVLFFMQKKQRRLSDEYLRRLQERQRRELQGTLDHGDAVEALGNSLMNETSDNPALNADGGYKPEGD